MSHIKLRNKQTGEFGELDLSYNREVIIVKTDNDRFMYHSLAELNEGWEDYTPQEEIGRQLVSSQYDKDFYWADEEQQEAFREFCREEDNRPENRRIPSDVYSDNGLCFAKEFGGVLSGNDRPRNMSEYNAWRSGNDFKMVREANARLGKERWLRFVREHGLEKFVEHKEPLINLKIDNNQKSLIEEAVVVFANQDKLRGGYHIKQAQEILNLLVNAELCGEGEE